MKRLLKLDTEIDEYGFPKEWFTSGNFITVKQLIDTNIERFRYLLNYDTKIEFDTDVLDYVKSKFKTEFNHS